MARQLGLIIGVAVFVAVLGAPKTAQATLAGFERGWSLVAGLALAAGAASLLLFRHRAAPPAPEIVAEEPALT
jgi:hypothetical protein